VDFDRRNACQTRLASVGTHGILLVLV
jgi:hypothetical protein